MTLRPFKLIFTGQKTYGVQDHRGQRLDPNNNTNLKLGIIATDKFWKKLLSYPITAFGYGIDYPPENKILPNPKFEKHEVIRALDFWIEYFVYQNKCDYILEGTVNKDFELHLEELIRVREAVLKESADTKYVRQKIRPIFHIQEIKKNQKMMVEFTENVLDASNTPFSTVDQFCYKVKTMTRKEYEKRNNDPSIVGNYVGSTNSRMVGVLHDIIQVQSNFNFEENFRDDGARFEWMATGTGIERAVDDLAESIRILEGSGTAPSADLLQRNDFSLVPGELGNMIAVGRAGDSLRVGDLIIQDGNGVRWIKAIDPILPHEHVMVNMEDKQMGELVFAREPWQPIYRNSPALRTDNDGFMTFNVPITAQSITVTDDESDVITYENMHLTFQDFGFGNIGDNSFVTVPVRFSGNGTEISMDIFVESGRNLDEINTFDSHRVQIRPNQQNFLEIDGQEYHTTNVSISHNPMRPSIRFDDLWIESVNITASSTNTMTINFLQAGNSLVRTNIEITLHEPEHGALMRQSIDSDQARAWSLQMLGNNRVNIGGDVYTVLEPLQINMN